MTDAAYTYNQPSGGTYSDTISEIRGLVLDTNPKAPLSLSDQEIEYVEAQSTHNGILNVKQAASRVAQKMSVTYGIQAAASKSVGNLSLSYNYKDSADRFAQLAQELLIDASGIETPSQGTYTYSLPSGGVFSDPVSEVRHMLSDNEPGPPYSQTDEEILYLIARNTDSNGNSNLRMAASQAARRMSRVYGKTPASAIHGRFGNENEMAAEYLALAEELMRDEEGGGGVGIVLYDDSAPEVFWQGQFDHGGTSAFWPQDDTLRGV